MNIITGYRGEAHITADQIRDQNQGCFGDGSYILDVGSKLEATAVSATSVQLSDGIISHQGCTASIPYGSTEAVTISNGTQGMQRIDLIVARYTKDAGTGVEDMSLAVIQGTPAASNPSTPSYNEGSIHAGDSPVDMPLFEVVLDGISIDSVTRVASVVKTQAETDVEISALTASLSNNLNNLYTLNVSRGRTYTQSKQQDTALLFVGKSGANAVVAILGRNGGTPFCTFLAGNSTFLTVSDSNSRLSFTTGAYCDGRIFSTYRTDETYEA